MQKKHYSGLSDAEVLKSRELHGMNVLTPPKKESMWRKFLARFRDPIIKILLVALVMSFGISIYEYGWCGEGASVFFEPSGILLAVLLATVVGFVLEMNNEKTFQSLNEVNDDTQVKTIRNDNICLVPRRDIVVGDIVMIETGDEVPADCQLLDSLNLLMNESSLTGEPQCAKTTDPAHFDKDATYPSDQILKGTTVIEGYGTARVIRVGNETESGKVFQAAQVEEGEPTPLSRKLEALAGFITKASYLFAELIIIGRAIKYFADPSIAASADGTWIGILEYALNTVMIAVTLIVVAVPEGLPMSITLSLAFSMKKLMKENTLPRTMHACETMGATSVICTDKTGTLTQNQMTVHKTEFTGISGQVLTNDKASGLIKEGIAANTTANLDFSDPAKIKAIGNPTEGALLLWLHSNNINYLTLRENASIIDRIPFTTELKYMATVVKSDITGGKVLYVKGAPEIVMGLCDISEDEKKDTTEKLLGFQSKAMRTLGFAYKELSDGEIYEEDGKLTVGGLHFQGIVAISDPVRKEVPSAIRSCLDAGIQVKIVTGDTPGTAKEIGRQVGLWNDSDTDRNILTGVEFASMSDETLKERIPDMKIMSRARPKDKERLVRLLKSEGMVVAVTGDGTNDAPALNAADVGLSMGDGTAVAKEASDMTIMDNSFSTISHAVMWGRSLYKNIQRFVMFQMTINVVACMIVLFGAFIGTTSPLTVTQMLWVNLIMDTFAALALASLPPSPAVMKEKPRKLEDSIISRAMAGNIFGVGGLFFAGLIALVVFFQSADFTSLAHFSFEWSGDKTLSPYELSIFFTVFVMLQFWNMFNAKAFMTGRSVFHSLAHCGGFLAIAALILVGQILIVQFAYMFFNVTPLCLTDWLIIIGATSVVLWVGEIMRALTRNLR